MSHGYSIYINFRGQSKDLYAFWKRHCNLQGLDFDTFIPEPKSEEEFPEEYTSPLIDQRRRWWRLRNWGCESNSSDPKGWNLPCVGQSAEEYDKNEFEIKFYAGYVPEHILDAIVQSYPKLNITIFVEPNFESDEYVYYSSRKINEQYHPQYSSKDSKILDFINEKYGLMDPGNSVKVMEDEGSGGWQDVVSYEIVKQVNDLPFDVILSNINPVDADYDDSFRLESLMLNRYLAEGGHLVFRACEKHMGDELVEALEGKFEIVETCMISDSTEEMYVICLSAKDMEFRIGKAQDISVRNFRYLDDLVHSGENEILLDSDIVLESGEKSRYLEGIKLDVDNLVIDGQGHRINACDEVMIFECTGKNIQIRNLTFENGFSWEGGAIFNRGDLTVIDSNFLDNFAMEDGGAICIDEGSAVVCNSYFLGNSAEGWCTGGIYNFSGNLKVEKSVFFDNSEGPVAIHSIGRYKTEVMDCRCEHNGSDYGI